MHILWSTARIIRLHPENAITNIVEAHSGTANYSRPENNFIGDGYRDDTILHSELNERFELSLRRVEWRIGRACLWFHNSLCSSLCSFWYMYRQRWIWRPATVVHNALKFKGENWLLPHWLMLNLTHPKLLIIPTHPKKTESNLSIFVFTLHLICVAK